MNGETNVQHGKLNLLKWIRTRERYIMAELKRDESANEIRVFLFEGEKTWKGVKHTEN